MSNEVYHDLLSKKKVAFEVTDNIFQLNEDFDHHLDKLNALVTLAHTHEELKNKGPSFAITIFG